MIGRSLACVGLLAVVGCRALAVPITFTHSGNGSGQLGGVPFGPADFTITATGDTAARVTGSPDVFFLPHTSAQIAIQGLGTFTFLIPTRSFVNRRDAASSGLPAVGFSWGEPVRADLFQGPRAEPLFAAWDMTTSIGPVVGAGLLLQWSISTVRTSGGNLFFSNQQTTATFSAVVAPAPGTIGLLGAAGVVLARRRR